MKSENKVLIKLENLCVHFPITKGFLRKEVGKVQAVDNVSLFINDGETLSLVGESGCGKSTLARCIVRIIRPSSGKIIYFEENGEAVNLAALENKNLKKYRQTIRMIFQDPHHSLNPRMTVFQIVGEPLRRYKVASGSELEDRVAGLLKNVGLRPEYLRRYPHAFSGGERQRIGIARALALDPRLVIADEAVSALDVSVQAQILNLMRDLQEQMDLTYLFITHDLSVVDYMSNRIAVMYVGELVELAPRKIIFREPKHPYTEALLSAVPIPDPRKKGKGIRIRLKGDVADPSNPPEGCYFHPRCNHAKDLCKIEKPELKSIGNEHFVACHFAENLNLNGINELI